MNWCIAMSREASYRALGSSVWLWLSSRLHLSPKLVGTCLFPHCQLQSEYVSWLSAVHTLLRESLRAFADWTCRVLARLLIACQRSLYGTCWYVSWGDIAFWTLRHSPHIWNVWNPFLSFPIWQGIFQCDLVSNYFCTIWYSEGMYLLTKSCVIPELARWPCSYLSPCDHPFCHFWAIHHTYNTQSSCFYSFEWAWVPAWQPLLPLETVALTVSPSPSLIARSDFREFWGLITLIKVSEVYN